MFSNIISDIELDNFIDIIENCSKKNFFDVLNKNSKDLTIQDFSILVSKWGENNIEELAVRAHDITKKRFGLNINLYVPIYLSNYCVNNCLYCGFRKENSTERKRLNFDEYKVEFEIVHSKGMQNILLVAGSDIKLFEDNYIYKIVEWTNKHTASVSIEIEPQSIEIYQNFKKFGLDGLVIYQETYNKNEYAKVHIEGKKRDYNFRIDTPDRAAAAGLRRVGLGILLGLSDWKKDIIYLASHLKYLIKKYWKVLFTVSLPRIRDAGVKFKPCYEINDKKFVQLICALRIFFPDTPIYLSTRETKKLRDGLIKCGITHLSAGSRTKPGAYKFDETTINSQFKVEDSRTIEEVARRIKELGYEPLWKDWEGILNG